MSNFRLRQENLRRAVETGTTLAGAPEKPVGLKAYRMKVKQSAARAKEARKKRSIRGSFSAGLQLIDCDSHEEIGP